MKNQLIDIIRACGATIYDPDFGNVREGWRVRSPEEYTEVGALEWVRQLQKIEPDSPTPSVSPATELIAVAKALREVGYEWRLQARDSYGNQITRLHVRPANNSLEERIIEHVCQSLKGMADTPSMWGTREAREATCFELMVSRWLASGQETQADEAHRAWEKAVMKVCGAQNGGRTLCDRFANESEEEFMDALLAVVANVKTRLPLQGARLRQFEKREERRVGDGPDGH